ALTEAARHRQRVEMGYQPASGAPTILVVEPYALRGDQIFAQDSKRFTVHVFDVGRVLWVEAADARARHRPQAGPARLLERAGLTLDDVGSDRDDDRDDEFDDDLDGDFDGLLVELDRDRKEPAPLAARRRR
ncbi:MAG: hypothetical protein ACRDM0_15075, partial [Thermoleophilaceae bacterium]